MHSPHAKTGPVVTWLKLLSVILVVGILEACSTVAATSGPRSRDLSVLEVGTHRHRVLAELEQPKATETNEDGNKMDVFSFQQGAHVAAKGGKAFFYGGLAVVTLGVSELVTTPLEGAIGNKGANIQLRVSYDENDLVEQVVVLKDDRWVPVQKLGAAGK